MASDSFYGDEEGSCEESNGIISTIKNLLFPDEPDVEIVGSWESSI